MTTFICYCGLQALEGVTNAQHIHYTAPWVAEVVPLLQFLFPMTILWAPFAALGLVLAL